MSDMAESDDENVVEKVNNLVASQSSLPNVTITEAERKAKPEDAGVTVVKCSDVNDRKKIMEAKSKLNASEHFRHIHIYPDKPRWQRQHEANVRLLVKSLGTHKLFIRGNRVCERKHHQDAWVNANRGRGRKRNQGQSRGGGARRGAPRGNHCGTGRGKWRSWWSAVMVIRILERKWVARECEH